MHEKLGYFCADFEVKATFVLFLQQRFQKPVCLYLYPTLLGIEIFVEMTSESDIIQS